VCCLQHQGDHRPDDGGGTHLWNIGQHLLDYTAVHLRRLYFILAAVRTWNLLHFVLKTRTLLKVSCASRTSDVLEPLCGHPWYNRTRRCPYQLPAQLK
jgi:hypothetical protein